jgi:RimJ/RimL family protein N-acetyltransferase
VEIDCRVCKVRSWRKTDVEAIVRHGDNVRVWRNLRDRFPHPYTREAAREWIEYSRVCKPETDFAIEAFGEAIGGVGLKIGLDVERFSAEVGYWVGEPFWGKGIATAALSAVVLYAFRELGMIRVFAVPFATNLASARVLEKAGFAKEALLRSSAVKEGAVLDQWLYAITQGRIEAPPGSLPRGPRV